MSKPLRIALAGAGAFGQKHLDALKLIDGVQVTSVIGRELDKTREVAARYGIGHATTDLDETLKRSDVDAVILCTPSISFRASRCFWPKAPAPASAMRSGLLMGFSPGSPAIVRAGATQPEPGGGANS